ncbi:zinc ribbon domain-containing protein, partial [bacterium]|nr:zinc ribbon domain-containing protein [bacterium]
MEYFHKRQVYVDRYDLRTIKLCLLFLKSREKMLEQKPFKKRQSQEEYTHEVDKTVNYMLYWHKAEAYQEKEEQIAKWMTEDKRIQRRYDTATPPNMKCEHCGKKMKEDFRTFKGSDYLTSPITFILSCSDCRNIKDIYENGSEVEPPPPSTCDKCKAVVSVDWTFKDHITTRTYTCKKCGNHLETVDDDTKFWEDLKKEEEHDKELLIKYRDEFCLDNEEGEKAVKIVEHYKLAHDVYEYELAKYDDPAKTLSYHAKKLDTNELEKLLNTSLIPIGYKGLTFGKVDIDRYVIIPFTLQDTDTRRKGSDSIRAFTDTMKPMLENTNWRLMKDDVMYRLGYLSGRLKGYEREDDLVSLFATKTPTRKVPEIDPERMEKYGYGGLGMVGLARISAEHEGKERIRAKKLVDNPG